MAELPYSGARQTSSAAYSLGTLTNYAGAVVSLGLMVGIGVWGYKVVARDVSGVPVVRAASNEPMRMAPEKPGGQLAAHQGLSVNEVMAKGGAEKPAERLVLAPKPVDLTEEDQPLAGIVAPSPVVRSEAGVSLEESDAEPLTPQMASIRALAEALADGVAPLAAQEAQVETVTPVAVVVPAEPVTAVIEAVPEVTAVEDNIVAEPVKASLVSTSLRPKLRPAAFKAVAPAATEAAVLAALTSEAGSIPVGTRLVQLGAFDSAEVAGREWERLGTKFGEYMDGKERVIQRAESGGRVFYRLRAMGFADLSDSRRFCAALVAERADCIPVVSK
ncbi:SPOR domain-containing protein [Lentibacter algarum]|uniref:SPOR domain-containing protein n=1 Tax=Lentibacter algarum TaxID=576131 RepID=UPI0023534B6E|nr:SPOR domain-containing protein [Lentibacter algarum]MCO4827167.1 SPOR domain-containing protein [Lentibacter algarum]